MKIVTIENLNSVHTHEDLISKFPDTKILYRKFTFGFYELYAHTFIKFYYRHIDGRSLKDVDTTIESLNTTQINSNVFDIEYAYTDSKLKKQNHD